MCSSEVSGSASIYSRFEAFLRQHELTEYDSIHSLRLLETLRRCENLLGTGTRILELGGLSLLSRFLTLSEGIDVQEYTHDLRLPLQLETASFDVVFMLEVLEHLNDFHTADSSIEEIAMFRMSGAEACLNEVHRVLKPGGYCVLTTPNAVSVDALGRILLKMHPFQYEPHVREYAPRDIEALAKRSGFAVILMNTFFSWNPLPGIDRNSLLAAIKEQGCEDWDRGDDVLFVLRT